MTLSFIKVVTTDGAVCLEGGARELRWTRYFEISLWHLRIMRRWQ